MRNNDVTSHHRKSSIIYEGCYPELGKWLGRVRKMKIKVKFAIFLAACTLLFLSLPGPGKEVGKGGEDVGKGASKGAESLGKGTAGAAGNLVTLHPGHAAADLGKGAAGAGKDVGVGTGKGAAKIGKGSARGIGKLGKKIFGRHGKNKKTSDMEKLRPQHKRPVAQLTFHI